MLQHSQNTVVFEVVSFRVVLVTWISSCIFAAEEPRIENLLKTALCRQKCCPTQGPILHTHKHTSQRVRRGQTKLSSCCGSKLKVGTTRRRKESAIRKQALSNADVLDLFGVLGLI